jgi:hypothetical protein
VYSSEISADYSATVVANLAGLMPPHGRIVLCDVHQKRSSPVEWRLDSNAAVPAEQYRELIDTLDEMIVREAYLVADVRVDKADGGSRVCVWHIINGGVFGLTADHGLSALFYHDGIWPNFSAMDGHDLIDAPALDEE